MSIAFGQSALARSSRGSGDIFVRNWVASASIALLACVLVLRADVAAAGQIVRQMIPSAGLKRDLPFLVYLPDGYAHSVQRYPVVYLLHGAGGDEHAWTGPGHITDTADRLIAEGVIPPAILVMPGCPASWWVDGAKDKAETAFWTDLVPAIDATYRTTKSRDGRFIAGISAGGYGAVRFGLKYPDRVGAVAALSPAVYSVTPPPLSSARIQPPFLKQDGTFSEASWAANNYPSLLAGYAAQKLRIGVFLATGDGDRLGIAFETALLHKRLFELQPDLAELRVLDGDHNWSLWSGVLKEALTYVLKFAVPQVTFANSNRRPMSTPPDQPKPE